MTETRDKLKRYAPETLAEDSRRVLNDPVFIKAIADFENKIVFAIANSLSNGSQEFENQERENCRTLRTLTSIKRQIMTATQNKDLKDSGFKAQVRDKE